MPSTLRFVREFLRPRPVAVIVEETTYRRDDQTLPATLYRPRRVDRPLPGWMTLHGLTYHGREHESLRRLARALAAAGNVILVPDLPEWRALRVAPAATVRTIRAAVLELDARGITEPGRVGVIGFSFGGTQALIASTDPALRGHLAGVASWGGYADIGRLVRSAFFGEHELDGRTYRLEPDPYGRWVLAGNYAGGRLGDALLWLAREAGRRRIMAWDPAMDPVKAEARRRLDGEEAELFDLMAPPAGVMLAPPGRARLQDAVDRMLPAALAADPLLDPGDHLSRVPVPVFLAHGRDDRLVPWTELIHLRRALPPGRVAFSGVTALFAHSTGERRRPGPAMALEAARFLRLMRRMLRLI
jgi:hypothetical protein